MINFGFPEDYFNQKFLYTPCNAENVIVFQLEFLGISNTTNKIQDLSIFGYIFAQIRLGFLHLVSHTFNQNYLKATFYRRCVI